MAFPRMLRLIAATPFFALSSPDSLSTNTPAYTDSSIESHHIPSVVFTRVCHPRFRSAIFFCSLLSSFVFRRLRRRHSSSTNRTLFSNQSSLPLSPFPGNRRPRRFKQHGVGSVGGVAQLEEVEPGYGRGVAGVQPAMAVGRRREAVGLGSVGRLKLTK